MSSANDDDDSREAQGKLGLLDLPAEVVLEHILPALPPADIATVSRLDRQFHALAEDEALWLELTRRDHAYDPALLAPPMAKSGWSKRVYHGLANPRIFVWGSADNGRLGVEHNVKSGGRITYARFASRPIAVPSIRTPSRSWTQLLTDSVGGAVSGGSRGDTQPERVFEGDGEIGEHARVVDLQAAGWSFTARTSDGGIYVWGQLDGSIYSFRSTDWHDKHQLLPEPTRVSLPCKAVALSTGRSHFVVLDEDNLIWEMKAWGTALYHTSPLLVAPSSTGNAGSRKHVVRISTGWNHSAALTATGDIVVWFPFTEAYDTERTPTDELNTTVEDKEGRSVKYGRVGNVANVLDALPLRPEHPSPDVDAVWENYDESTPPSIKEKEERVVKIASGVEFLVALKANGEVWYYHLKPEQYGSWVYLAHFSGPDIKHITAQFNTIVSYSTNTIHYARAPTAFTEASGAEFKPTKVEGLEGKDIIQVSSGDYHSLALTSSGEVWAWGTGSMGQLGHGPATDSDVPVRVDFGEDVFAFGITAAGHHSGALVFGGPGEKGKGKATDTGDEEEEDEQAARAAWDEAAGPPGVPPITWQFNGGQLDAMRAAHDH